MPKLIHIFKYFQFPFFPADIIIVVLLSDSNCLGFKLKQLKTYLGILLSRSFLIRNYFHGDLFLYQRKVDERKLM